MATVSTAVESLNQNCPKDVTDISAITKMPSKSNCEAMLGFFKFGKHSAITCSLGTYTMVSIETLLKIHSLREISQRVKQEVKWLKISPPHPNDACLLPDKLDEYKSLLFQNSDGKVVINKTILASDLACLACDNWLNLATIQGFVDLLNDQSTETAIFVLNNLIGLNKKQLQALTYTLGKVNYITFIVNIGGNLKETFVAQPDKPGWHWTLLFMDATENKWFYCDTLGWATPSDLKPLVDSILDVFSRELSLLRKPAQGRFVVHKPDSHVRDFHKCTSNCFDNIHLQSCGNICGVIVTIMGAISCIEPTLWRFGFLSTKSTLPKENSWLKCPTSHACYLRRVLIHWLMAKNVNLQLLGINSSTPSAYTNSHSFGQQCSNDDLLSTTDPKYSERFPESSQSQPKKPHISEDGKIRPSGKSKQLLESSSPDDDKSNPSHNGEPLPTSPDPDNGKSKPSENGETILTSPGPENGESNPPDNGEPLPESIDSNNGNSNLSENGDARRSSPGPDDGESKQSENSEPLPASPDRENGESIPSENDDPPPSFPGPGEGESKPSEKGEPLPASPDRENGKSISSENGDPPPSSPGPNDGESKPSEKVAPLPASPGPDDGQSNPPDNGEPLEASLGPDNGQSNLSDNGVPLEEDDQSTLSENGDPPTTPAGPDDSESNPS